MKQTLTTHPGGRNRSANRTIFFAISAIVFMSCCDARAQTPGGSTIAGPGNGTEFADRQEIARGGIVTGTVTAAGVRQRGASITVVDSLTASSITTTSDFSGSYSIRVRENGLYYIYAEFGNLPAESRKVVLGPLARWQQVDFSFRVSAHGQTEVRAETKSLSKLWPVPELPPPANNHASFNSNVLDQTSNSINTTSVQVPAFAGEPVFSVDSFSINGQQKNQPLCCWLWFAHGLLRAWIHAR